MGAEATQANRPPTLTLRFEVPTLATSSSQEAPISLWCGTLVCSPDTEDVVAASSARGCAGSGHLDHALPPGMHSGGSVKSEAGMPSGTIARLLIDKGFGFIRDEGGVEHFFHRSSVRGAVFELLREGQRVEFTPEESGKGPRAGDIRLLES